MNKILLIALALYLTACSSTQRVADTAHRTPSGAADLSGTYLGEGLFSNRSRTGNAALEVVQHIDPGRQFTVEGCHSDPELPIQTGIGALPLIKSGLVVAGDVVQRDEDLIFGLLGERGKGAVPALATEGNPPSHGPPRAALW